MFRQTPSVVDSILKGAIITEDKTLPDGTRLIRLENCLPGMTYTFPISIIGKSTTGLTESVKSDYKKHNKSHIRKPVQNKKGAY